MVIAGFGLLLIAPSVAVGLLVVHHTTKLFTFMTMMTVFSLIVLIVEFYYGRVLNSAEGVALLAAQVLTAFTVVGIRLPIVSRLHSMSSRNTSR